MTSLNEMIQLLITPTIETLLMVSVSSVVAFVLGLPIGICLYVTQENGIMENRSVFRIFDALVNMCRSLPFIILMILLFPLSRIIVGNNYRNNSYNSPTIDWSIAVYRSNCRKCVE